MRQEYVSKSPSQTKKIGERLGREILKKGPGEKAFVIGLEGELGGGKTTFLQGFAKGIGVKEKILSPTFVIYKKFQIRWRRSAPSGRLQSKFQTFYHIDCYRIKRPKELLDLDYAEIISNPKNIVAIEWPERIKRILPKNTLTIEFRFIEKGMREIVFRKKKF